MTLKNIARGKTDFTRLAHMVRNGASPSEVPVETAEVFLIANIKTAEKIDVNMPYNTLCRQIKLSVNPKPAQPHVSLNFFGSKRPEKELL